MRRAVLFSFYDDQGIIDDYVVYFLKELRKFSDRTLFYSNGPLATGAEAALRGIVDEIIIRKNEGFDVWAHKEGLENIGFDRLGDYDEILMVNHTCYGPIFPLFAELICGKWKSGIAISGALPRIRRWRPIRSRGTEFSPTTLTRIFSPFVSAC